MMIQLNYPTGNLNKNGRNGLELVYASEALRSQCTNVKAAKKLFHGDLQLSVSLLSRINALEQADVLKDIRASHLFQIALCFLKYIHLCIINLNNHRSTLDYVAGLEIHLPDHWLGDMQVNSLSYILFLHEEVFHDSALLHKNVQYS